MSHPLDVTFYMQGGHAIKASGVQQVAVEKDTSTGKFTSYSVTWHQGQKPSMFTLSLSDLVAVVAVENPNYTRLL